MHERKTFSANSTVLSLFVAVKQSSIRKLPLVATLLLFMGNIATAATLFQDDFEGGNLNSGPSPKWSWNAPISAGNIQKGMMYGKNDIYTVSNSFAHTGSSSLRLDFAGRNNWCNQCGSKEVVLSQSDVNAGCVAINGAPWGNVIYNKSNGFSTWKVTSQSSSKVCFDKSGSNGGSVFTSSAISSGDQVMVPFVCGVNGIVGGNTGRRSDCNKAINYLNGVSSSDFGYGKTLSRRFYVYLPSSTKLPGSTLKLGYAHFRKNGGVISNTLKVSVQRARTIELSAPGGKYATNSSGYSVPLDTWHYFEEVFTRESSAGASNGSYKLYAGAASRGDNMTKPIVVQNNVQIGELVDMSVNGNFQHNDDAKGYIYFDDVLISDRYVGPANGGSSGSSAPPPAPEQSPPVPPKLTN